MSRRPRESRPANLRGELDASDLDDIGVLVGALSRTQAPQLEDKEGFGLRHWV